MLVAYIMSEWMVYSIIVQLTVQCMVTSHQHNHPTLLRLQTTCYLLLIYKTFHSIVSGFRINEFKINLVCLMFQRAIELEKIRLGIQQHDNFFKVMPFKNLYAEQTYNNVVNYRLDCTID